jgi:hypothetical protein
LKISQSLRREHDQEGGQNEGALGILTRDHDDAPSALQGDVIQIVMPGAPPLVLPKPSPSVTLDAAGLCALAVFPANDPALPETRVYDVLSGTSTALQGLTNVVWL